MNRWLVLVVALPLLSWTAQAQAPPMPDSFRSGANYRFERTEATRIVRDDRDRGPITLVVYVWKPLAPNPTRVVLFSHGSTGGGSIDPREPIEYAPRALIKYFVTRGYTFVMPLRRGVGWSGGTFIAECAYQAGQCSLADNRTLARPGLDDAVLDTAAVLDQVIFPRLASRGTKVLFAGISRGGLLSLRMAAERPTLAAGVLNFVGGWLSVSPAWPAAEQSARQQLHAELLRDVGARTRAPTLWVYGSNDPFYPAQVTRGFFEAFRSAGGRGEYVYISEHQLPSGHAVAQAPDLWADRVDAFLKVIESPARADPTNE